MALDPGLRILAAMTTRTQPAASRVAGNVGRLLKQWRERRRLSQLALAVDAEISSRHLSFIETGRAQPSRDMVMLLTRVLDVPPRGRNDLLTAAGYAPVYRETGLEAPEMADVRRALDFIMRQQEPYPGLVIDGHWNILMTNGGARRLMGLFLDADAVAAVGGPPNAMRLFYHPRGMRPYIVNWDEVAGHLVARLHREISARPADETLPRLLARLLALPDVPTEWRIPAPGRVAAPFATVHLRSSTPRNGTGAASRSRVRHFWGTSG